MVTCPRPYKTKAVNILAWTGREASVFFNSIITHVPVNGPTSTRVWAVQIEFSGLLKKKQKEGMRRCGRICISLREESGVSMIKTHYMHA